MSRFVCGDHKPVQHRDRLPPWCKACGLTADFAFPTRKDYKVADNLNIKKAYSSDDEGVNYLIRAKSVVLAYAQTQLNYELEPSDIYVVWFSKTLQNWKALVSTSSPDGRYYELTYNGDKGEIYLDVYKKEDNVKIEDSVFED